MATQSSCLRRHPQELPRFKELIFEDFSQFLLVENMYEEVVLQSVSKDIMMGELGVGGGGVVVCCFVEEVMVA